MRELTQEQMIWNRACGKRDPMLILPGDRALADMLRVHGLAMNGGVLHAVECLPADELSDAQSGYRFFGFDAVAALLFRARSILDTESEESIEFHERRMDERYAEIIPNDMVLVECFERFLTANPSNFAPIGAKDME